MATKFDERMCIVSHITLCEKTNNAIDILSYINRADTPLSLKRFLEDNHDFIVENTEKGDDFQSVWSYRFRTNCKNAKKVVVNG
jgi:hypothetical protein